MLSDLEDDELLLCCCRVDDCPASISGGDRVLRPVSFTNGLWLVDGWPLSNVASLYNFGGVPATVELLEVVIPLVSGNPIWVSCSWRKDENEDGLSSATAEPDPWLSRECVIKDWLIGGVPGPDGVYFSVHNWLLKSSWQIGESLSLAPLLLWWLLLLLPGKHSAFIVWFPLPRKGSGFR